MLRRLMVQPLDQRFFANPDITGEQRPTTGLYVQLPKIVGVLPLPERTWPEVWGAQRRSFKQTMGA